MRILLLLTDSYGQSGGIAKYNRDFIAALGDNDAVRTVTVVPRHFDPAAYRPTPKVSIRPDATRNKLAWLAAASAEAGTGCDAIVCGHINLLPVAAALAMTRRVPLALIVHGIDAWDRHPSILVRMSTRAADAVWAVSSLTRDRFAAWSRVPLSRFALLPGTVQLDDYGPGPRNEALAAKFGLESRPVLLTVARLPGFERYKGIDEILEVLPEIVARNPLTTYAVAGDGEDRPRLEAKAARLGVADHVRFLGFVDEADKADLYRLADVFVMPGRGEGLGLVYLEALACGTPAVGSKVDGSREALRNGELGELVDPASPADIVGAIERSLAKPREVPAGLAYFAYPSFANRAAAALGGLVQARTGRRP